MSRSSDPFKPSQQLQVGLTPDLDINLSGRPPTNIGPQGAHASAYHLIEMLVKSIQQFS